MKLYKSVAWLRKRYIQDGKTIEEMAREADVQPMTIRRALEKEGLK
jgi:DeoR/GlpR family transcriptional regulator of sugar metabolism